MPAIDIDRLWTLEEAAKYFGLGTREVSRKCKGPRPAIHGAIWLNQRTVRFYPRVMLAMAAFKSGVPTEMVKALFAFDEPPAELLEQLRGKLKS